MKELLVSSQDEEIRKEARFLGMPLLDEVKDVITVSIASKEDELAAIEKATGKYLLVKFEDDEIIPLENLIANLHGKTKLLVMVNSSEKAKTALETLEIGADGIVLQTEDPTILLETASLLNKQENIKLETGVVKTIRPLGLGARACIDTCSILAQGAGMLVGSSSRGMLLIQAEVEKNEFVAPRPFRVNAGAVSLYTIAPGNKTRYLEELSAGDGVLVVNRNGSAANAYVCRSKIELRPMVLVEVESNKKTAKAVLQNAETVKLVTPKGSIAVTDLKTGDNVIAHFEDGGRHFGVLVREEEVIEK